MISRFANPARFMRLSATALPWCGWGAALVVGLGLFLALVGTPGLPAGRDACGSCTSMFRPRGWR